VNLDERIRKVPDFPKKGILFYDITSVLMDPEAFGFCVEEMVRRYKQANLDAVAAIESRGFLFAAPFALRMGIPLVLVRKQGKLPGKTYSRTYELEYGSDTIEVHQSDIKKDQRILIVDDLVATGGTIAATAELIREVGSKPVEAFSVVGLPFLNFADRVAPLRVHTLVDYESE
jgi:adenine phosphoribosyltransferase